MTLTAHDRDRLVAACVEDTADRLARDADYRVSLAKHGHAGFAVRGDAALVQAFGDAGLAARYPGLELPSANPGFDPDTEVTFNDVDDPLTPGQMAVVHDCRAHFPAASQVTVYQTIHGHIVEIRLARTLGDGINRTGRLTCADLAFLASFGERIRWVEAHLDRITLGL